MLPTLRRSTGTVREEPLDLMTREFDTLRQDIGRMFGRWPWPEWSTADTTAEYPVDICEKDNKLFIDAELPGFKKNEIDISVDNGVLRITAERKTPEPEGKSLLRERMYQRIERRFTLPRAVDDSKAVARFEDGVLHLELPETGAEKAHHIKVA